MNPLNIISLCLAAGVFTIAILTASNNPRSFLDFHGFLVVIGGTVAATAISVRLDRALLMMKVFWHRAVLGRKTDFRKLIGELLDCLEASRKGDEAFKSRIGRSDDPFLKDCMLSLLDSFGEPEEVFGVLEKRAKTVFDMYMTDANRFKAIGKYPPAMGLLGAVTGMIALLGSLGQEGAEKNIGPAMSVALVATLYGIALANFFVLPIAEYLVDAAKEIKRKNAIIIEAARLVSSGANPVLARETLLSHLLPGERITK